MAEIESFFNMGGYAWYVWPAFGASFIVLLANVVFSRVQFKRVLAETSRRAAAKAAKNNKTTQAPSSPRTQQESLEQTQQQTRK